MHFYIIRFVFVLSLVVLVFPNQPHTYQQSAQDLYKIQVFLNDFRFPVQAKAKIKIPLNSIIHKHGNILVSVDYRQNVNQYKSHHYLNKLYIHKSMFRREDPTK